VIVDRLFSGLLLGRFDPDLELGRYSQFQGSKFGEFEVDLPLNLGVELRGTCILKFKRWRGSLKLAMLQGLKVG
jgi:hypothetical protein